MFSTAELSSSVSQYFSFLWHCLAIKSHELTLYVNPYVVLNKTR